MGRKGRRSGLRSALAERRRFPVDLDQLDEAVDAEASESCFDPGIHPVKARVAV